LQNAVRCIIELVLKHGKAIMYFIPRIFAKITLLAVLLLSTQAGAEQPLVTAAIDSGSSSLSVSATDGQAAPGYFSSKHPVDNLSSAEPESDGMSWMLLVGGAGLGLVFFWLGRRSGASSAPLDTPRHVAPALRVKPTVARASQVGGAASSAEARYWVPLDQATTVTVDELSSVEEEAEVFLLLGRMDMAIGVLRHHVEANDAAPANVWMSLLDVLHAQGLRQEFEKLAAEIRERFNVALPTWEGANARSNELTELEHFPHLFAKITAHWSRPDCLDYLRSLTQDNRNGERSGFHLEAFRELLMLIGVLENREKIAVPQAMAA
jgi:hypothetical protein